MSISFDRLSTKMGMDDVITFGTKHRGYTVEEVLKTDPSYISWLATNTDMKFYVSVLEQLVKSKLESSPKTRYNYDSYGRLDFDQRGFSGIDDWFDDVPF